jgi:hypothetical protein
MSGHILECNGRFSIRSDDCLYFLFNDGVWRRPGFDGHLDRWPTRVAAEAFLKECMDAQDQQEASGDDEGCI